MEGNTEKGIFKRKRKKLQNNDKQDDILKEKEYETYKLEVL